MLRISVFFLNHSNILLRADHRAVAATFTKGIVAIIGILLCPRDTALRTNDKAHLAGYAVLFQKLRLGFRAPRACFIVFAGA
jgi:hypothetical protein